MSTDGATRFSNWLILSGSAVVKKLFRDSS